MAASVLWAVQVFTSDPGLPLPLLPSVCAAPVVSSSVSEELATSGSSREENNPRAHFAAARRRRGRSRRYEIPSPTDRSLARLPSSRNTCCRIVCFLSGPSLHPSSFQPLGPASRNGPKARVFPCKYYAAVLSRFLITRRRKSWVASPWASFRYPTRSSSSPSFCRLSISFFLRRHPNFTMLSRAADLASLSLSPNRNLSIRDHSSV